MKIYGEKKWKPEIISRIQQNSIKKKWKNNLLYKINGKKNLLQIQY